MNALSHRSRKVAGGVPGDAPSRGRVRGMLAVLAGATALLWAAAPAFAVVTATPNPNGTTISHIPATTLTSTVAAATIGWTITGPNGFSIDGSGTSPVAIAAQAAGDECPLVPLTLCYTLTVSENAVTQAPALATFSVDRTPPNAPVVTSGPSGIVGPAGPFTFAWTTQPTATSSHWQLLDGSTLVADGTTTATQVKIPPPTLAPGDRILNFRVSLLDAALNPSEPPSTWAPFVVDQTPPGMPVELTGPVGTVRTLTPAFSWLGTEEGATFKWNVTDEAGKSVLGPGIVTTTPATSVQTPKLSLAANGLHHLTFHVSQIDPHGNQGPEATTPFTISTNPCTGTTRWQPFMSPSAGQTGVSLTPLLKWRRIRAGTTVFAVQILRGDNPVLLKYPTRNRLRIPTGRLRRGTKYTWNVYSYIGRQQRRDPVVMTSCFITRR